MMFFAYAARTRTHAHARAHTRLFQQSLTPHARAHTHAPRNLPAHARTHARTHACMHACMHAHTHTHGPRYDPSPVYFTAVLYLVIIEVDANSLEEYALLYCFTVLYYSNFLLQYFTAALYYGTLLQHFAAVLYLVVIEVDAHALGAEAARRCLELAIEIFVGEYSCGWSGSDPV